MHRGGRGEGGCEQVGELVNLKAFFVATLSSALDLGIAVPDDVLRHVTPDILANNLPRPLWARLLTACVGAPKVDAQLVIETIGVPNLCEHVPANLLWACIDELGKRALDGVVMAPANPNASRPNTVPVAVSAPAAASSPAGARPMPLATPPPPPAAEPKPPEPKPVAVGPSIPSPLDDNDSRTRAPAGQRFRPSNTGVGRLATNPGTQRRPQAQATTPPANEPAFDRNDRASERIDRIADRGERTGERPTDRTSDRTLDRSGERTAERAPVAPPAPPGRPRRGQTEADYDLETFVGGKDDWKTALAVEDEQLVDWAASDETVAGEEIGRKR